MRPLRACDDGHGLAAPVDRPERHGHRGGEQHEREWDERDSYCPIRAVRELGDPDLVPAPQPYERAR
jgi:hypothetical protein